MTTPTVVIGDAPNPVPAGDSIRVQVTVTPGSGGGRTITEGDTIALAFTLPSGFSVVDGKQTQFKAPAAGKPFNLTLQIAGTTAVGANAVAWTWSNLTNPQGPFAGAAFSVPVGYSTTATLVYTMTPVPPVLQARLATAVTAVAIPNAGIEDKVGCVLLSDNVTSPGGDVARTIVYTLPYSVFQQFNGANVLPKNSKTRQFYAVTTAGLNATVGELLYDNGSGVGTVAVVPAISGLAIIAAGAASFTGGTQTFTLGHRYSWNGAAWVDQGAVKTGRSAFQQNFPASAGAQKSAFASLYTSVFGSNLGTEVTASPVAIA